jgi:transaldolase/glucose-6-phosphate isomerase
VANPLQQLAKVGQSFWLDNLGRGLITSGELERLIRDDGLRGITSNPTIFEKSLASSDEYDPEMQRLAQQGASNEEIFESLAIHDIRRAADLLRPVYKATSGQDGFVSLELPPFLATDTERSVREAKRLFATIGRANVMIKVPGTAEGIPAIERLIAEGVNVNITLLFSLDNYAKVIEAYLHGMERRREQGKPIDTVASVASFFVSRVDTEIDKRIDQLLSETDDEERKALLGSLKGKAAIANAKMAYQLFLEQFSSPRFDALKAHGARVQRPLWASTSTKNPAYSDVLYVEALIGPDTVETMAPVSVEAFRDHGKVRRTIDENLDEARRALDQLAEVGISLDEVTDLLQRQGVDAFAKSFDGLLAGIDQKRTRFAGRSANGIGHAGAYDAEIDAFIQQLNRNRAVELLWAKDGSLWSDVPEVRQKIQQRLGWLDVPSSMLDEIDRFTRLAEDVRQSGFTHAVLLGMGGSSLAPEVFQRIFGRCDGYPELTVLDTTNPDAIARVAESLDLAHTLFIVSSKSGTTVETSTLQEFFARRLKSAGIDQPGQHFIAITDPDTKLEQMGREQGFRAVFTNPPDIGGRYSALSYFGLVPAAIMGLDVRTLLERAVEMADQTRSAAPTNPGLWLGAALGLLAEMGRDKVTFVPDPMLESLADWLEQLIAESTGKEGTGLVPIAHEPRGATDSYGSDRVFVGIDLVPQPHAQTDAFLTGLEAAGHPVIRVRLRDEWDVAAEFVRWEVATAIVGAALGINPFDEPNVQESKDNTNRLLGTYRETRSLPEPSARAGAPGIAAMGNDAPTIQEAIEQFLGEVGQGDYLAIMAFSDRTPEAHLRLQEVRRLLRDRLRVATTLGYGPRFLHSIGQLYKGGPQSGAFLQIVIKPRGDLEIPGEPYSFGTLFAAQALGDFEALQKRSRPLLRLVIDQDAVSGLDRILQTIVPAALR